MRFIHNAILSDKIAVYEETKQMLKVTPAFYKKEFPWLKEVDSHALVNAHLNVDKEFFKFYRLPALGYPRFKCKRDNHDSYTTNNVNGGTGIYISNGCIKLPKTKPIKIKQHRDFKGVIKSATVSKEPSGKYYVSLIVEQEDKVKLPPSTSNVGIDLGVKGLIITSNGDTFAEPDTIQRYEAKLEKEQKKLSYKKKGSSNWNKQQIKVARIQEKISNIRKDNLHKVSHKLIQENQVLVTEKISAESKGKNQSADELIRQLSYKSAWNGRTLVKAEMFNGGTIDKRDTDTAEDILTEGLKSLAPK